MTVHAPLSMSKEAFFAWVEKREERYEYAGGARALEAKAPILIVEVLSPGTLHIDFGEKRQEYLSLPTLDTYLIVSPDEPRAWIWQRTEGVFPSEPEIVEGQDKQIVLSALGTQLELGEIYRGIL